MKRKAVLIGVPLDLGASKQGAAQGPSAIRRAKLLDSLRSLDLAVEDCGDIKVPAAPRRSSPKFRNAAAILEVCQELEKRVHAIIKEGNTPIVLGGDHSLAMGSISGAARALRERKRKMGLIWVDAHADINTPQTSPSGNIHGMPMAHLLGLGDKSFSHLGGFAPKVEPQNLCLVGVRDVDKKEAVTLRGSGARVFSMQAVDRHGMGEVMDQALSAALKGTDGFYLSFDIDAVDPQSAPGTGARKSGGLTYREAHLLMEMAAQSGRLVGLDLVEVNPLEDMQSATAVLAAELINSAFGKTIY